MNFVGQTTNTTETWRMSVKPDVAYERVLNGDVPSQPFHHGKAKMNFNMDQKFVFADGEFVTVQVTRILIKQQRCSLLVEGDRRFLVLRSNDDE